MLLKRTFFNINFFFFFDVLIFIKIIKFYRYDFAKDKTKPVLTPIDYEGELGRRDGMAQCDVNQINRYYKCMNYLTVLGPDGKPEPRK